MKIRGLFLLAVSSITLASPLVFAQDAVVTAPEKGAMKVEAPVNKSGVININKTAAPQTESYFNGYKNINVTSGRVNVIAFRNMNIEQIGVPVNKSEWGFKVTKYPDSNSSTDITVLEIDPQVVNMETNIVIFGNKDGKFFIKNINIKAVKEASENPIINIG